MKSHHYHCLYFDSLYIPSVSLASKKLCQIWYYLLSLLNSKRSYKSNCGLIIHLKLCSSCMCNNIIEFDALGHTNHGCSINLNSTNRA